MRCMNLQPATIKYILTTIRAHESIKPVELCASSNSLNANRNNDDSTLAPGYTTHLCFCLPGISSATWSFSKNSFTILRADFLEGSAIDFCSPELSTSPLQISTSYLQAGHCQESFLTTSFLGTYLAQFTQRIMPFLDSPSSLLLSDFPPSESAASRSSFSPPPNPHMLTRATLWISSRICSARSMSPRATYCRYSSRITAAARPSGPASTSG